LPGRHGVTRTFAPVNRPPSLGAAIYERRPRIIDEHAPGAIEASSCDDGAGTLVGDGLSVRAAAAEAPAVVDQRHVAALDDARRLPGHLGLQLREVLEVLSDLVRLEDSSGRGNVGGVRVVEGGRTVNVAAGDVLGEQADQLRRLVRTDISDGARFGGQADWGRPQVAYRSSEPAHHGSKQPRPDADSRHTDAGQPMDGVAIGTWDENVHGSTKLVDEPLDLCVVVDADRKHAVRPGFEVRASAVDDGREKAHVRTTAKADIDARVKHDVDTGPSGGSFRVGDALGLRRGSDEPAALVVGVLQVHSNGSRAEQSFDEIGSAPARSLPRGRR
jgi:hypothetical protein